MMSKPVAEPDGCPNAWGDSQFDRLGCPDSDGDGWSDPTPGWPTLSPCNDGADAFPNDPTQWCDDDGDGFGSNQSGNNADDCPGDSGTSTEDRLGCPDRDGDGYSNAGTLSLMTQPSGKIEMETTEGTADGNNPDQFPDDASQWEDSDGDGRGDNPGGNNGDRFLQTLLNGMTRMVTDMETIRTGMSRMFAPNPMEHQQSSNKRLP